MFMKHVVSVLMIVALLCSASVVYAADYSSMTVDQLKEQLDAIRNELTSKGLIAENKTVLLDKGGVTIYLSDSPYVSNSWTPKQFIIPIIVINNTDKNIYVSIDKASLNGWASHGTPHGGDVPAGKKAKVDIMFPLADTDIEITEDFEDAEFTITIGNSDEYFVDVVPESEPITIYAAK